MSRELAFWNDGTIRLVKEHFIAASVPTWVCRAESPEGEFLRRAGIHKRWVTSSGYMHCVSASGKLLGGRPSTNVLEEFEKLPESERRPGAVQVPALKPWERVVPSPPEGGLVLRVHARFLCRGEGGELRHARTADFPLMRGQPQVMRTWRLFLEPSTEYMWLRREEWKSLVPADPDKGKKLVVDPAIAQRMARFHLTPQRATTSEGGIVRERSVKEARLALVVDDVSPGQIRMKLEGFVHWGSHYDESKATTPDGPLAQGFETRLHGRLDYDRTKQAFTRFDVVAPGHVWGRWGDANGKSMYVERPGRAPFGFAFELATGDSPTDRIPPGGNGRYVSKKTGYFPASAKVAAWPQVNGPFGNFNPRQFGVKLIDDLNQARQLWISEYRDLGFAKGSSSGYVRHLVDANTHPGAASGLIVADGKVFASSFRPSGAVWAERLPHLAHEKNQRYLADEKIAVALRRNAAILADDLTVAIDLATGKTVWEAIEKGRGLNRYSGKRNHFGVTPAYYRGKVFSMGTMGIVYCYDAKTGRKHWEDVTGSLVTLAKEEKAKLIRERTGFAGGDGMSASLVLADGVLIVPQFTGKTDIPLRGVDINDGKTLWEIPDATCKYATPAVWTHDDRQYLVCANVGEHVKYDSAKLRLIDPRNGRIAWTVAGLAPTWFPLSPSDRHVLVNVPSAHINPKKRRAKQPWGLMAAYRLSPEKAERVWTMPDKPQFWFENHLDICCMRRVQIRDGRVFFFSQGHTIDPAKSSRFFSILEESTGRVLLTTSAVRGSPQFWVIEDRLLVIPDAAHGDRSTLEFYTTAPSEELRKMGEAWKPPHQNTTAYEVFIELPYIDGRFLMRTWQGQIVCYDLRRQ